MWTLGMSSVHPVQVQPKGGREGEGVDHQLVPRQHKYFSNEVNMVNICLNVGTTSGQEEWKTKNEGLKDLPVGVFHEENLGKSLSLLYLNGKNKIQSRRILVSIDRI